MRIGGGSICPGTDVGLLGPGTLIPSEKGSMGPKKRPFFFCCGVGDSSLLTSRVVMLVSSASVASFFKRSAMVFGFLGVDYTLVTTPLGVVT